MNFSGREISFADACIMGILNATPDSFSDGGLFLSPGSALSQAARMVADGAAIIDVGGESTRPGAARVSPQEELDRVCPVIEAVHRELDVVISVDTSAPEVMREAVRCGAALINDVRALRREGALEAAVELGVPVCLMHMQGEPETMQLSPRYEGVVTEVRDFLASRVARCISAGMAPENILVDPGFGFGKTLTHNLQLLQRLDQIVSMGFPVLVGVSRKAMIGHIVNRPVGERAIGSSAAAAVAVLKGAAIVRAHDVRENADAIKVASAIRGA